MTLTPDAAEPVLLPKPEPLKLQPPTPVATIEAEPEATAEILPDLSSDEQTALATTAKTFALTITQDGVNSPAYRQRVKEINDLAKETIVAASGAQSVILQRKSTSLAAAKKSGGDAGERTAKQLSNLRTVVEDLSPDPAELTGITKILGIIPGGSKLRHYFQRYESAQDQIVGILNALRESQDSLRDDNASLTQTQDRLWGNMISLNKNSTLLGNLDKEVTSQIADLRGKGDTRTADALSTDVLYAIKQRRQDILTQLAVSEQGYLVMDMTRKSNDELVRGVDRASTTTVNALEIAVTAAMALERQKLVLNQLDAIKGTTEKVILNTSILLKQNTSRIQEMAANPAVSLQVLQQAWQNITDTIDSVDQFRATANTVMDQNIQALTAQAEKVQPILDRAHAANDQKPQGALTV